MNSGIYEIVNSENGKRYVGSAVDFEKRWKAHRHHLERGTHHSRHMQSSWAKHGSAAFAFRRLIVCDRANLLMYEQIAIDALAPEYNTARVAGSCLGIKHSDETRAKLSASKMGNQHTLGHRHTDETKAKQAASKLGNTHTKGKPRNPEAVAKTAEAHRGMKRSDETKARISAARLGKKLAPRSAEHCAAISAALKGKPKSPEAIARMTEAKRGQKLTDEHKARIGAASRAMWAAKKQKGGADE